MDVKINVRRKYIVDGKEYNSVEEMPSAIREAYQKATGKVNGIEHHHISSISSQKVLFNGQEYESINSMPSDVRLIYETVMKTVREGRPSAEDVDNAFGKKIPDPGKEAAFDSYNISKPIMPESSFSIRNFVILAVTIALLTGIYFLFKNSR